MTLRTGTKDQQPERGGPEHFAPIAWQPTAHPKPEEPDMATTHDPFDAANQLAPTPDTPDQATRANWVRHYAAQAVAAHVAFRAALRTVPPSPEPGSRPDLGYLIAIAVASTAAAAALADPANAPELIYNLTPEAGALNGEYLDWLDETLVAYGINPADIDPDLEWDDFADAVVVPAAPAASS